MKRATCVDRTERISFLRANFAYTWGACLIACCLACTRAVACSPSYEQTIIFNQVPMDVDAPVIAEVTIIAMTPDLRDRYTFKGDTAEITARVENVIKGDDLDERTLKIVTPLSDCSSGFGVGSRGFVAGELRRDQKGTFELVAISERWRKANSLSH